MHMSDKLSCDHLPLMTTLMCHKQKFTPKIRIRDTLSYLQVFPHNILVHYVFCSIINFFPEGKNNQLLHIYKFPKGIVFQNYYFHFSGNLLVFSLSEVFLLIFFMGKEHFEAFMKSES